MLQIWKSGLLLLWIYNRPSSVQELLSELIRLPLKCVTKNITITLGLEIQKVWRLLSWVRRKVSDGETFRWVRCYRETKPMWDRVEALAETKSRKTSQYVAKNSLFAASRNMYLRFSSPAQWLPPLSRPAQLTLKNKEVRRSVLMRFTSWEFRQASRPTVIVQRPNWGENGLQPGQS